MVGIDDRRTGDTEAGGDVVEIWVARDLRARMRNKRSQVQAPDLLKGRRIEGVDIVVFRRDDHDVVRAVIRTLPGDGHIFDIERRGIHGVVICAGGRQSDLGELPELRCIHVRRGENGFIGIDSVARQNPTPLQNVCRKHSPRFERFEARPPEKRMALQLGPRRPIRLQLESFHVCLAPQTPRKLW